MNIRSQLSTLTVCVAISLAGSSLAAQRRGGFGGGFGGPGSEYRLLSRADVQRDLAITPDQKAKLDAYNEKMRAERGANRPPQGAPGTPPDAATRAKMQADRKKRTEEMRKAYGEIITPAQDARLKEISIQLGGNLAILNPDVQKQLSLTSDQEAKIKDLQTKQAEANRKVFERVQSGDLDRSKVGELMTKNNDIMKTVLGNLLTTEQASKLKALGGAPFTADPDQAGGRGF